MAQLNEDELATLIARIEPVKVGALFFRSVPFQYANSVDSVQGALIHGGRFNPPQKLARELCNLPDGFGYLYTATNPLTCILECGHVMRGLAEDRFQSVPVNPTLLVSFKVDADNVLDLRKPVIQALFGFPTDAFSSVDHRAVINTRGSLTQLKAVGASVYKSGRFSGILTPSRFADLIPSFCFTFLPREVRYELHDAAGLLRR